MDQNRIDRLFREKLDHLEVKPSADSWGAVEKQIQSNKKGAAWYWIAASLALLFTCWMVWPDGQGTEGTPILARVDHPTPQPQPELILPEIKPAEQLVAQTKDKKADVSFQSQKRQVVAKNNVQTADGVDTQEEDVKLNAINLRSAAAVAEVESPELKIEEEVQQAANEAFEYQPVKITYIASSAEQQVVPSGETEADSTGVLKKFIAFTEKIDPGEMLADIKTAKDNLFSTGFKSKKDKNSL